ncbi:MAG: FtsW/RodA/SpoVE family cell cycle protein [Candidatus Binatus sp.]|nr:FtsW/RodA/SpoVE family cell cycle protein [Candidatus Binatus sp.]MDO8433959.1 FtsW/RodA/SpoVE family cell cycle protein [Candidatus Binatus sp.]
MLALAAMLAAPPVVGITLPLASDGRSSLIAMMAAIGILININARRFLF